MEKGAAAICVLGSANCDYNFNVDTFPKEGETIQATKSYILNGGKVKRKLCIVLISSGC